MNSPYGSLDYPTYSPGYDPGWESTPSTDEDFGFDHYGFPTYADEFTSVAEFSTWPSASTAALATPQAQQYHFNQGQQVWSILQTHVQQLPQAASTTNNRGQNNAELMRIPQNGAITPLAGLGISTDSCCTHPCDTADHPSATPENLQALFPSPTLPRIAPPCLYDNNVSPPLQKQNPRFEGDLYAALWVRGEGASRAGWCGFCASWHKLKDSAYWYVSELLSTLCEGLDRLERTDRASIVSRARGLRLLTFAQVPPALHARHCMSFWPTARSASQAAPFGKCA